MQSDIVLSVSHVSKQFPVKKRVLNAVKNVSLTVNRGDIVGIVGESGCGKSTLAKMIAGSLKPTEGEVLLSGTNYYKLHGAKKRAFRKNIQMVFQDPLSSFSPRMKVGTYICEPRVNYDHVKKEVAMEEAKKLLTLVGLPEDFVDRHPHELSGGQLQRVAIARAIAIDPLLLICDEATSALDVTIQDQIAKLLVEIIREKHMSAIFIGHDLALVRSVTTRIVVMYLGSVVEIIDSEDLEKCEHPYTKALLNAIFDVYCDQSENIPLLEGEPPSPLEVHPGCAFAKRCPYATETCVSEMPELRRIASGHFLACHNMCGGLAEVKLSAKKSYPEKPEPAPK